MQLNLFQWERAGAGALAFEPFATVCCELAPPYSRKKLLESLWHGAFCAPPETFIKGQT